MWEEWFCCRKGSLSFYCIFHKNFPLYWGYFWLLWKPIKRAFRFIFGAKIKHKEREFLGWRNVLAYCRFCVKYRTGSGNIEADAFSRMAHVKTESKSSLCSLHDKLSNLGVTKFEHYINSTNLPHTLEDWASFCHMQHLLIINFTNRAGLITLSRS